MLKKILLGVVALIVTAIVVVVILASMQPTAFTIERSVTINAPAETIYPVVSDLRRFKDWSPWQRLDPSMISTFGGTQGTVGASYAWKGNDQVGEGRMTVTDLQPNRLVGMRLEFLAPFKATNHVDWRLAPSGAGTEVSWVMSGHRDFMTKVMCVFMDMDAMVGGDFERGLANLERIAENGAH